MTTPPQQPEGALIEAVMTRKGVKAPWVAAQVKLSSNWVRFIIAGSEPGRGGQSRNPVVAPADTLARIAHALDITPQQLIEVGRDDAAERLEAILAVTPDMSGDLGERIRALRAIADNPNRPDYLRTAARGLLAALTSADQIIESDRELGEAERRRAG